MPRAVVFPGGPGDRRRRGRTLRALRALGLDPLDACSLSQAALAARIAGQNADSVWLVRAGAWPLAEPPFAFPPGSATGRPLVALGAVREGDEAEVAAWTELLAHTGGDLTGIRALPPRASLYCEEGPARAFLARLAAGEGMEEALAAVVAASGARVVRDARLDVGDDPSLRVVLAVTSLQQGGAERVVLNLVHELGAEGVRPLLAVTGRATRAAFASPAGTVDLSRAGPRREDRIDALGRAARAFAADLVHAHLLGGEDLARLAGHGVPVVVTVHNTRDGWPEGLERLAAEHAVLLVGCSLAAEADLVAAGLPVPARTVWNGIDTARLRPSPALRQSGVDFRRQHGLAPSDLVLLAVANPRPQKRLHLLPAVLAAARDELSLRGVPRQAKLVVVGDAEPRTEAASLAARALREEIDGRSLGAHVRLAGSLDDPAPALAAADVLVSVSAHEGLSLAHLEALAAGLPVVATDAGGTREILRDHPALTVLPLDAAPERVAAAALDLALDPVRERATDAIEADFSRRRMAARYAHLYPRAVEAAEARGVARRGLVLVTNNFSTGGAQSSARRLLTALAAAGIPVSAVVLQEQHAFPTPGRRALAALGIPVLAAPPPDQLDAADAVERIAAWIDAAAPRAVLFWNALAEHKILLADALLDVPVYDVSPGEMYYAALDRTLCRPRPGLPYRDARAYGARLAGVIVKYAGEAARAAEVLGAPVHVVPNGVPLPDRRRPRPPRADARVILGTAARLSPQKKLGALLDALRRAAPRLPPHVLRIAGTAERGGEAYAETLRAQAAGLSVEWVGEVEDTGAFLADLDVFAMISEPAGCPNASLEAMAAGLPVVATDFGGAGEQVVDGVTGRLVGRDDEEALAAALVELAGDEGLRDRLGTAGRARVEERFALATMVEGYRRVCLG